MRIANNIVGLNVINLKSKQTKLFSESIEKMSSGLRICNASDDAAGLTISEKMRGQIRGLSQASRNIQDGISLIQTADGALSSINVPLLARLRDLAVQASNDTLVESDRDKIQCEVKEIINSIDDIAKTTMFNGIHLLDGSNPIEDESLSSTPTNNYDNSLKLEINSLGAVNLKTNLGYSNTTDDDNAILIYQGLHTSKPSVLIDGVQHNLWSKVPDSKTQVSEGNVGATWTINNVKITQSVIVDQEKFHFEYQATNVDTVDHNIGFYFHIDTMLGNDDQAPFIINGEIQEYEESYSGVDIPESIALFNHNGKNIQAEGVVTGALLSGPAPDEFRIGYYNDVSDAYGWTDTNQLIGDSGYAIKWNESVVSAGGQRYFDHKYGISIPQDLASAGTIAAFDLNLQIGPNSGDSLKIKLSDVRSQTIKLHDLNMTKQDSANKSIVKIDNAIRMISSERGRYGAYQNRLEHALNNVNTYAENLQATESRIADFDMVGGVVELAKLSILNQSTDAMLAQANQLPNGILQLLN